MPSRWDQLRLRYEAIDNVYLRVFPGNLCPLLLLIVRDIDQLRRERLSYEYHYPPFWWSKLPVVVVGRVLDNEAIDIEAR